MIIAPVEYTSVENHFIYTYTLENDEFFCKHLENPVSYKIPLSYIGESSNSWGIVGFILEKVQKEGVFEIRRVYVHEI